MDFYKEVQGNKRLASVGEVASPKRNSGSLNRVAQNYVVVPLRAELRGAGQRFVVDIVKPESLAVSICPFEIIEQTP